MMIGDRIVATVSEVNEADAGDGGTGVDVTSTCVVEAINMVVDLSFTTEISLDTVIILAMVGFVDKPVDVVTGSEAEMTLCAGVDANICETLTVVAVAVDCGGKDMPGYEMVVVVVEVADGSNETML